MPTAKPNVEAAPLRPVKAASAGTTPKYRSPATPLARLTSFPHLLQLADQGPALRAALAEEVAELLTAWPADYPESMRGVCEALLAKAARDVDAATRARLRVQLYSDPDLSHRVLPRRSVPQALIRRPAGEGAARTALAQSLGVDDKMALQILDDETGAAPGGGLQGRQYRPPAPAARRPRRAPRPPPAALAPGRSARRLFRALARRCWPARASDRAHAFHPVLDAFRLGQCPPDGRSPHPPVCAAGAAQREAASASPGGPVTNISAWPGRATCRQQFNTSRSGTFGDIAELPGALGQEHRRAVAVGGHAAAIGGGELLHVRFARR